MDSTKGSAKTSAAKTDDLASRVEELERQVAAIYGSMPERLPPLKAPVVEEEPSSDTAEPAAEKSEKVEDSPKG